MYVANPLAHHAHVTLCGAVTYPGYHASNLPECPIQQFPPNKLGSLNDRQWSRFRRGRDCHGFSFIPGAPFGCDVLSRRKSVLETMIASDYLTRPDKKFV
jgi:hypothetical protein